jgi:hypothetical protein
MYLASLSYLTGALFSDWPLSFMTDNKAPLAEGRLQHWLQEPLFKRQNTGNASFFILINENLGLESGIVGQE